MNTNAESQPDTDSTANGRGRPSLTRGVRQGTPEKAFLDIDAHMVIILYR